MFQIHHALIPYTYEGSQLRQHDSNPVWNGKCDLISIFNFNIKKLEVTNS
jgi:hypothetical protein